MRPGLICVEGPDGSGKTTLARSLFERLEESGFPVMLTRQPGGSILSSEIRKLLLERKPEQQFHPTTQMCLFYADRFQHLHDLLLPALEEGKCVICDRSELSTYTYQIHAPDRFDLLAQFKSLHADVRQLLAPYECRTFVCELTVEEAERRLLERSDAGGEQNVFDVEANSFKRRVHTGMKEGRDHLSDTYHFESIDAMQSQNDMLTDVLMRLRS